MANVLPRDLAQVATDVIHQCEDVLQRLHSYSSSRGLEMSQGFKDFKLFRPVLVIILKQMKEDAILGVTSEDENGLWKAKIEGCRAQVSDLSDVCTKHFDALLIVRAARTVISRGPEDKLKIVKDNLDSCIRSITSIAPMSSTAKIISTMAIKSWERDGQHWAGTNKRFEVDHSNIKKSFATQLKKGDQLGRARYGGVWKVTYRSIPMARKSLKFGKDILPEVLATLMAEPAVGVRVEGHPHIVKVVGTYKKQPNTLDMLTFPVGVCDLGQFLDDYNTCWNRGPDVPPTTEPAVLERLKALGFDPTASNLAPKRRLMEIMGCITQAMIWMHERKVQNRDLKPPNIILRPREVYLTDFGISRDRAKAERTTTDRSDGHTEGYAAPEIVSGDEYNAYQTDIYSLGCVFLHILTEIHRPAGQSDIVPADINRHRHRELEFRRFLDLGVEHAFIPSRLIGILRTMFLSDRRKRPYELEMSGVDKLLRDIIEEEGIFHGSCCLHLPPADPQKVSLALLQSWEEDESQWSGTGERYDVAFRDLSPEFQSELEEWEWLGESGIDLAYSVKFRGTQLAIKSIYPKQLISQQRIQMLKDAADLTRRLDSHRHIRKLVGTFSTSGDPSIIDSINLLLFPVPTCNLNQFLNACEKWDRPDRRHQHPTKLGEVMDCLRVMGYEPKDEGLRKEVAPRLHGIMGCTAKALVWLHDHGVHHLALNPTSIILRGDEVFLKDFWMSSDHFKDSVNHQTLDHLVATQLPAHVAPEVTPLIRTAPTAPIHATDPEKADVYSLGCILLRILTAIHAPVPAEFASTPYTRDYKRRDDFLFFITTFSKAPVAAHPYITAELVDLMASMFRTKTKDRPAARAVDTSLWHLGGQERIYHGPCCHEDPPADPPSYEERGDENTSSDEQGSGTSAGGDSIIDVTRGVAMRLGSIRFPESNSTLAST